MLLPTVTETVAVELAPCVSVTVYVMVALPEKLPAGMKLRLPSGFTLTVPWPGCASTAPVTVKASPSTSRSLASTSMVSGVLIGVAARSLPTVGASFAEATLSVSVEPVVSEPSETV